jgi:hypothetical protein
MNDYPEKVKEKLNSILKDMSEHVTVHALLRA